VRILGVIAVVAALAAPVAPAPGCAGQQAPPPPSAREELVQPAPEPLPWPAEPVGGAQLGTCGETGTTGAPQVGAAAWVVADMDSGAVLAARAPHARHRPASTLKVLTALVALRYLDPDAVVDGTAADQQIEGSKAGIGPGGHYTVRQLLAGLLLSSGNDTAEALARAQGGDVVTRARMSAVAGELGALDTSPASVSGLDGPGMATSAYDLALLFRVAMRNPLFASTLTTRSVPFPGYGDRPGFVVSNTSHLLGQYPGALGDKTGFTDAARHTIVGAAERNGRRLVVALVRGEQHPVPMWKQAAALLDWGFAQPAGTAPVGTLVDRTPVVSPLVTNPSLVVPDVTAREPSHAAAVPVLPIGLALAAGTTAVLLTLRRRSRR
jgi:D-alanyl-D-alanine carboxypeptidase (penicillin-binding protein 5/6)